jgi:DNA-directed RNA polymerase I subunit RPA1
MTASKVLKTPTMLLPLMPSHDASAARALARKLSRLPLSQLLSHTGAVEVGEKIAVDTHTGDWKRHYRVRLHFQSPARIKAAFGTPFEAIAKTVKGTPYFMMTVQ